MEDTFIRIKRDTNKSLALYQLQRDFRSRDEAIKDALIKAVELESLKNKNDQ